MSFAERIDAYRERTESTLGRWLEAGEPDAPRLREAMAYAVLGGGKRVRPLFVYAAGETLSIPAARLDGPAAAVEIIHAYSLVHDDLPAMDDDDLRRGRPTCHRAFDEATAILAGDALQVLAFRIIAEDPAIGEGAAARLAMIAALASAAGDRGMAGGQMLDLEAEGRSPDAAALERIHALKTGALISASVGLPGALLQPLDEEVQRALDDYGQHVGLAFQIQDDILDVAGDESLTGKASGADQARDKATYPALLGLEGARSEALRHRDAAVAALAPLGDSADPLALMADLVIGRDR